jgi:eukaryotic-like serine/threonine-protein kinase
MLTVAMSELIETLRAALAERYNVDRELGRGGMATVFLAEDIKLRRAVAIKVLHRVLWAGLGPERFLREIAIAARLQHPHILPLYDSGTAGGVLYYVMPYVKGESLRDRLNREKQLSLGDTVRLATEIASALEYAHTQGVVHRDIKPENILVSGGHAVVADFGIARAVSAAEEVSLTQTGMAIGTPAYMSPEQFAGGNDVGPRSDVYSLGCVVYEMVAGHPPFTGDSLQALMARHTLDSVPSLHAARLQVPRTLERAVRKALAKTPADRFATAALFAAALTAPPTTRERRRTTRASSPSRRAPSASPPLPTPPPPPPRRFWGIRRGLFLGVGALAVLLGVRVTTSWRRSSHAPAANAGAGDLDPRHIAVRYFEDLSRGQKLGYLADGLTEALIDQLAPISGLQVVSKDGVARYRGTAIPRDSLARALQAGSLIEGSVEDAGERVRVSVRLVDGASGVDVVRRGFEAPAANPLLLRDELAQQVGTFLRQRLGEEVRLREQKSATENVAAWVLVQQAEKARKDADSLARRGDVAGSGRQFARADSLLATAEAADQGWVEPVLLRGWIAYRRSRLAEDPAHASPWIDGGLGHAERALERAPKHARALELRGTLNYWRWLEHLAPDPREASALLRTAEKDLRSAVSLDPSLAGAWSALSHLDYQKSDIVQAKIDAQRAYEADAYYSTADQILWRLFTTSYDLEQLIDAVHWCEQGRARFPGNPRFVQCQILAMTARMGAHDVPKAWQLLGELQQVTPPQQWSFERLKAQMIIAAVIARAGFADSARHVLLRSRGAPDIDPRRDLPYYEAFVRWLLGDTGEAIRLLKQYVAAYPERRADLARDQSWWFRDLRSDPRYEELAGTSR